MLLTAAALLLVLGAATACSKKDNGHDEPAMTSDASHNGHGKHQEAGSGQGAKTTATWSLSNDKPEADAETEISIRIADEAGKPVEKFTLNHEKELHLIIVSKDLSVFQHLHPVFKGDGLFEVADRFPAAGEYKLIADYVPDGGAATTQSTWVTVGGQQAALQPIQPDSSLTKTVDGVKATLSFDHVMADMELTLTFHLTDAKTNEPITDLEPYLGAVGHVVILSSDAESYLHVHPAEEKAKGPDAVFKTTFPSSGVYKIWGQFQRGGQTFIVPFTVQVP